MKRLLMPLWLGDGTYVFGHCQAENIHCFLGE